MLVLVLLKSSPTAMADRTKSHEQAGPSAQPKRYRRAEIDEEEERAKRALLEDDE